MLHALLFAVQGLIVSVHDGDTVQVRIGAVIETVRLISVDTPELPPLARCTSEARKARAARDRLASLAPPGSRIRLVNPGRRLRDRYGRLLADIILTDGRNVGAVLVAEGLARPWTGKRQPWCRHR